MLKLSVREVPGSLNNELFLVNLNSLPGMSVYYTLDSDKQFTAHHFTRNEGEAVPVEPLMVLPDIETKEIIAAFATYAEEHNIDYEGQGVNKGKVEAMKEHIKDLRSMLHI